MREPAALRRRAGLEGDPDRDQYFLEDTRVLDRILALAASNDPGLSHVLEVGPGVGALTSRLVTEATRVTAIERDGTLVAFLREEFATEREADRLKVIEADALECELPAYSSSVSNLPYGISSPLLFRLLPRGRPLTVMVQREFGERMAASPGTDDYSRLSVTAQHYGGVTVHEIVPPSAFRPQPPVDSAIVSIEPRAPSYAIPDEASFLAVVRAIFTQRRKTLRNAIRNTTHISGIDRPERVLDRMDETTLGTRPEQLPPETFAEITRLAFGGD